MDLDIHQLYLRLLSGQNSTSGPAPFFQPTPPPPPPPMQAPMMGMGVCQWAADPVAMPPQPTQRVCAGNAASGLPPGTLAPGEGSLTAGGDAFLGGDQPVEGLEDELLALMRMTGDELSAFLSDDPGVDPPELLMRSLPVPPAGGPTHPSSGSPGLGCAQARAIDSPASGVVDQLMRMGQSSSGSPGLGSAQVRATDSPASGVVEPLTRMSGDGLSAFLSDGAVVNSLCVPPECLMNSLAPGKGSLTAGSDAFLGGDQSVEGLEEDLLALMMMTGDELSAFLGDGPGVDPHCVPQECLMRSLPVPPAGGPSQPSSGSPALGCAQARATDSPASGVVEPLTRMSGDGLSAFLSDGAAVNSLCVPPECLMNSLAPGKGSLTAGSDAFLGGDQSVEGLEEDLLALMMMTGDELSAFLGDGPGVDPHCVPQECLMRSLPVPPAGGPSQPSSGSPALGCAQARATDSPASGVVEPLMRMSGDGLSAFLSDGAAVNSLCVPPECLMNSLVAYQPMMHDSPPVPPAGVPSQPSSGSPGLGCAYPAVPPAAYLDAPQQVPDSETAEVAQMVRMAARCADRPSTTWSVEEDELLLQGLSRFAKLDNASRCFSSASLLADKTALDVAYRIRWMTDLEKKKAAKELQLGQEKPAGANVTKGKGTKVANKKNNKHPLSKEALDSRSTKDIIRDNNRLMDKIEEILRTGEVKNCADYFYYVKMNMDAMQNKVKDLGSVMEGLSVGDEEWEDVLKDRDAPQAGEDAATPAS